MEHVFTCFVQNGDFDRRKNNNTSDYRPPNNVISEHNFKMKKGKKNGKQNWSFINCTKTIRQ